MDLKNMRNSKVGSLLTIYFVIRVISFSTFWVAAHFRHRHFLTIFARWDAQWYESIAQNGYGFSVVEKGQVHSNEAFFPLFPILEKFVHELSHLGLLTSGVLISVICGGWATVMIFKITEVLTNSNIALITSFLWIIYPIAYVDNLAYSETLFTALVATTLYCWHRAAIKSATLFAFLAGLTRPTGLALVVAIAIPAIYEMATNPRSRRSFSYNFAIFASGSGWLAYILYLSHKNNNLFSYFSVQSNWGNGLDGGRHFLIWISNYLFSRNWYLGILLIMALALGLYLLVGLYKSTQFAPILIFATLLFILTFSTQGYFGSKARYLLPDFPLLIPIAVSIKNMKRRDKFIALGLLSLLGLTFGAIAATGHGPP